MSSTYVACVEAANALLDDPGARPITEGPEGVFTELDVALLAARTATRGMADAEREEWMATAQFQAAAALGMLWRTMRAARYGPVMVPGANKPDYLRIDSKIVYSPPDGPAEIFTPNGTFPRIFVNNDPAKSRGRRHNTSRNDLMPWSVQDFGEHETETARLKVEITALKRQLAKAQADNEHLRAENERLRITRGELLKMTGDAA